MDIDKNAISEHRERLNSLVSAVTQHALDELHALRDQTDELIAVISQRQERVEDDLRKYAEQAEAALATKAIMADALVKLRDQFVSRLPPVKGLQQMTEKGNGKDD